MLRTYVGIGSYSISQRGDLDTMHWYSLVRLFLWMLCNVRLLAVTHHERTLRETNPEHKQRTKELWPSDVLKEREGFEARLLVKHTESNRRNARGAIYSARSQNQDHV